MYLLPSNNLNITAGDSSNDLLKVSLDIFDQRECVKTFADREINKLKNGIIDSQICAGVAAGGKDTCQVRITSLRSCKFFAIKIILQITGRFWGSLTNIIESK